MLFEIHNTTKYNLPKNRLYFSKIAEKILGKKYQLSLVLIGDKRSKELNKKYRNKSYVPNILSFTLEEKLGEIYINPLRAKKECRKFDMTEGQYFIFLFIHGCLHLKGLDHGSKMESLEKKFLKLFK